MKVSELEQYRKERFGDAAILIGNPAFSNLVRRFLDQPNDASAKEQLLIWLAKYQDHYDYSGVLLLDTTGTVRMSLPAVPVPNDAANARLVSEVLATGEVALQDLFRSEQDQRIYCSLLIPILDASAMRRPLGVLVLRIDPQTYLFPFINRWPTPSQTAETLLVRRDGSDALFLNELRFQKGTALTLRFPLSREEVPAVRAVLGQLGTVEGRDYRGVPVIAHLAAVPQSPWFLVARVDQDEVFAPLHERLRQMIGFVIALLLGAGAGLGFIWRQRSVRFYREHAAGAATLQALSTHQEVLLSTFPDIIMEVDHNKIYTWANQAGLEFFGQDVVGRDATFYFEGEQRTYQTVQPLFAGEDRLIYLESWQRRKDGEKRLLAWRCGLLKRSDGTVVGALSSARDVTEQRKAEQELAVRARIAEIFLTAADDQMYDEVLKVILDLTQSPIGVFGYLDEAGELVIAAAVPADGSTSQRPGAAGELPRAERGRGSWPRALQEKKPYYSNEGGTLVPTNTLVLARQLCVPILLRGEVVGLLQVANRRQDYAESDSRLLETIAGYVAPVLHAQLLRRRHEEALQLRNDEMMRFTYTVSHDLKSPLVTVTTFLGYLEKDVEMQATQAMKKDFDFIRNATVKMSTLLDELLELSRVGRKTNPSIEVSLQDLVHEALQLTAGQLTARGVTVEVTDEPFLLFGDRQRLVEIYQNLIDNAVKFVGEQTAPRIEIGVTVTRDAPVFFVRDNGIGIDPRHLSKLFGLFEKLDPHTEGSGMGLALVRRIVEIHGGKIWVESAGLGAGTTFSFTLAKTRRAPNAEEVS